MSLSIDTKAMTNYLLSVAPHVNPALVDDWIMDTAITIKNSIFFAEGQLPDDELNARIDEMLRWHIRRLSGIGGSDMSALYCEYTGGFYPFAGADNIVKEKLCISTPNDSTGDTMRGNIMEPFIERSFLLKMSKFGLVRYQEAFDKLAEFEANGGWKEHPWVKSGPDGVYLDNSGKVWLVDFKCPSEHASVDDMMKDPPDYYRAQIAQYKLHLEKAGIKIDRTALVPFSIKEMSAYVSEFVVDPEMERNVLAAGDYYWQHVLENKLPRRAPSKNFRHIREVPQELKSVISQYIAVRKYSSVIDDKSSKLKDRLLELSLTYGVDWTGEGKKTRLPGVDISHRGRTTDDVAALKDELTKLGVDVNDERFKRTTSSMTVSVIRSKKSEHFPHIEDMQSISHSSFEDFVHDITDSIGGNGLRTDAFDPTARLNYEPEVNSDINFENLTASKISRPNNVDTSFDFP